MSRGWYPIIAKLDHDLAAIDPDYIVHQVKQKYGGLRYYFHTELDDAYDPMTVLVTAAERQCEVVCEDCGAVGEMHTSRGGWLRTLCQDCRPEE